MIGAAKPNAAAVAMTLASLIVTSIHILLIFYIYLIGMAGETHLRQSELSYQCTLRASSDQNHIHRTRLTGLLSSQSRNPVCEIFHTYGIWQAVRSLRWNTSSQSVPRTIGSVAASSGLVSLFSSNWLRRTERRRRGCYRHPRMRSACGGRIRVSTLLDTVGEF
jgi:hypothetical protein